MSNRSKVKMREAPSLVGGSRGMPPPWEFFLSPRMQNGAIWWYIFFRPLFKFQDFHQNFRIPGLFQAWNFSFQIPGRFQDSRICGNPGIRVKQCIATTSQTLVHCLGHVPLWLLLALLMEKIQKLCVYRTTHLKKAQKGGRLRGSNNLPSTSNCG